MVVFSGRSVGGGDATCRFCFLKFLFPPPPVVSDRVPRRVQPIFFAVFFLETSLYGEYMCSGWGFLICGVFPFP